MKITNNSNGGLFGGTLNWINARLPYLYKNSIYPSWDVAEMLILSRCSHVLKNHSAFSSWAKIVNPDSNMYRISKCKNDWFPDYYLPEF